MPPNSQPLGAIRVDFIADIAKFIKNTKDGSNALGKFGTVATKSVGVADAAFGRLSKTVFNLKTGVVALAGVFGSLKLAGSFNAAAEAVDKMNDASKRIGVNIKSLSALSFAAGDAGLEFETLSKLIGKAQKNLAASAFGGGGPAKEAIGKLKLDLLDTGKRLRDIDVVLPEIAMGLGRIRDHGEKLRLSEQIFGREGGGAFVQWLEDSGNLVGQLGQKVALAGKLGVVFTSDQAEKLAAYRDSIDHVKAAWLGLRVRVMTEVAPVLTEFLEDLAVRIAEIPDAVKAAATAINQVVYGDSLKRERAVKLLADLRGAIVDLIITTGREAGRVLATTLVEAFTIAFTAVGPALGDVFRDNLGPILNKIPGVEIAPSAKQRLRDLQAQYSALASKYAAPDVGNIPSMSPYSSGTLTPGVGAMSHFMVRRQDAIGGRPVTGLESRELERLGNLVKAQEALVSNDALARTEALARTMEEGFSATAEAIAKARARIADKGGDVDAIVAAMRTFYDEVTPQEGATDPAVRVPSMLDRIQNRLQVFGASVAQQVGKIRSAIGPMLEKFSAVQMEKLGLDARLLRAQGGDAAADRIELQLAHQRERVELVKKYGVAAKELLPTLVKIQEIEARSAAESRLEPRLPVQQTNGQQFIGGMRSGLQQLIFEASRFRDLGESIVTTFGRDLSAGLSQALIQGRAGFKDFGERAIDVLENIGEKIADMILQMAFLRAVSGIGNALFTPSYTATAPNNLGAPAAPGSAGDIVLARGGVIAGGRLMSYAKGGIPTGIINDRVIFPMRDGKIGQAGEAGEEYGVEPVRLPSGRLGVAAMGGNVMVQIIDQRGSGSMPEVSKQQGPNGQQVIRVLIKDAVNDGIRGGAFDRAAGEAWGVGRRPTSR